MSNIYIRVDNYWHAEQALFSAVAAMQLGQYAECLVLCAIVVVRLANVVPKEKSLAIVNLIRAKA